MLLLVPILVIYKRFGRNCYLLRILKIKFIFHFILSFFRYFICANQLMFVCKHSDQLRDMKNKYYQQSSEKKNIIFLAVCVCFVIIILFFSGVCSTFLFSVVIRKKISQLFHSILQTENFVLIFFLFFSNSLGRNKDAGKNEIVEDTTTKTPTSQQNVSKNIAESPSTNENECSGGGNNWWGSWINTAKSKVNFRLFNFFSGFFVLFNKKMFTFNS